MNIRRWQQYIGIALGVSFTSWWVYLSVSSASTGQVWWSGLYGITALFGAVCAIINGRKWGGWRTDGGRALYLFAVGLLLQEFGQLSYSYYAFIGNITIPYPSVGDIGFFGSIPCYVWGMYLLGNVASDQASITTYVRKMGSSILPAVPLIGVYLLLAEQSFLRDGSTLGMVLNFLYPLGDALFVSLALFVYMMACDSYITVLRRPLFLFCLALVLQFVADYMFVIQANAGIWVPAGSNDFVYFLAYLALLAAVIRFGRVFEDTKAVVGIRGEERQYFHQRGMKKRASGEGLVGVSIS